MNAGEEAREIRTVLHARDRAKIAAWHRHILSFPLPVIVTLKAGAPSRA